MRVKELIIELLDCNPNADIKCVTYENKDVDAKEFPLNIRTLEDYDYGDYVDIVLDDLELGRFGYFEELRDEVIAWGKDKDLLHDKNAEKQFLKFVEEVFEFRDEWLLFVHEYNKCSYGEARNTPEVVALRENMKLEMGDIFVTLIILCEQLNMDPVYCLREAYEKIKDRKGKTINGVFIKEEDLKGDLKWQIYKNKDK